MASSRALITGAGGQLASDLTERLAGIEELAAFSHAELDIGDAEAVSSVFERVRPDTVFNCAAFHNLEVCERDERRAHELNSDAVEHLARLCNAAGARLVHISTNYVFDGDRSEPYGEEDETNPRSAYARSKLAGELAASAAAPQTLIVRTAGLYGMHGSASKGGNFVNRMLTRAREQGELTMVSDQRLTPTYTADLADSILAALERGASGVVHLTNSGACSWLEFTKAILEEAGFEVPVNPVETTIGPDGVDRPLNGVLRRPRADSLGIPPLRPWREALADYMQRAGLAAEPQPS